MGRKTKKSKKHTRANPSQTEIEEEGEFTLHLLSPGCRLCADALAPNGAPLLICGRCKGVHYCSKEHQVEDWSEHKRFCKRIRKRREDKKAGKEENLSSDPKKNKFVAYGDLWADLNRGDRLYQCGQFPKAMAAYFKAYEMGVPLLGDSPEDMLTSYRVARCVGRGAVALGDYETGMKFYKEGKFHIMKTGEENNGSKAMSHMDVGYIYHSTNRMSKALRQFEKAEALLIDSKKDVTEYYGHLFDKLGHYYQDLEDFEKAKGYFEQCIEKYSTSYGPNHTAVGRGYVNLARQYMNSSHFGESRDAEKGLEYANKGISLLEQYGEQRNTVLQMAYSVQANLTTIMAMSGNSEATSNDGGSEQHVQTTGVEEGDVPSWNERGAIS